MRPISKSEYSEAVGSDIPFCESDHRLVNQVFTALRAIFPAWRSAFRTPGELNEARLEWVRGLVENRIRSKLMVERGLRVARRHPSPFIPSVGEFVHWCRHESDIGDFPSVERAYHEAALAPLYPSRGKWSHLVVYYAGRETGWYELRHNGKRTVYPVFRDHYERICEEVLSGRVLTDPADLFEPVEDPRHPLVTPEEASCARAQVLEMCGITREEPAHG